MIQGATRGAGGSALSSHLQSAEQNENVRELEPRGLTEEGLAAQMKELVDLSAHGSTNKPVLHVHFDPEKGWSEEQWERHISNYEKEFGLENQPRIGVEHEKNERTHRHYCWSLVKEDGKTVDLSHDYARREKLSRIAEFETGADFVAGKHNKAVIAALEQERPEIAEAMREAGLDQGPRPVAMTPDERHQHERTQGPRPRDVGATALAAWQASDDGQAFRNALAEEGLELAEGRRGACLVDDQGGVHSLSRVIGTASKEETGTWISASEVKDRVAGLELDSVEAVQQEHRADTVEAASKDTQAPAAAEKPSAEADSSKGQTYGGSAPQAGGDDDRVIGPSDDSESALFSFAMRMQAAEEKKKAKILQMHLKAIEQAGADLEKLIKESIKNAQQRQQQAVRRPQKSPFSPWGKAPGGRPAASSKQAARSDEKALERERHRSSRERDRGSSEAPARGQEEPRSGAVRGSAVGAAHKGSHAASGASGASRRIRKAGQDHRVVGARDRDPGKPRQPPRTARVRAWQEEKAAGRSLTPGHEKKLESMLSRSKTLTQSPKQRAVQALERDQARIRQFLSSGPWSDPAERDPRAIARARVHAAGAPQMEEEARERLEAVRERKERAEKAMGPMARIGFPTKSRREVMKLEDELEEAEDAHREAVSERSHSERQARDVAPEIAKSRKQERSAWQQSLGVQNAHEQQRLNQKVMSQVQSGNPEMARLAAQNPAQARQLIQQQEWQEEQLKAMKLGKNPSPGQAPSPAMR